MNEYEGVRELSTLSHRLYPGIHLIVADDGSADGTQEAVFQCMREGHNIRLLDRSKASVHGLTASVVDGIVKAETKYIVVMDADMQHPPEAVGKIIAELDTGADLVIGTREYLAEKWNLSRLFISRTASRLAQIRLFFSEVSVRDPLSGFFGIRRDFATQLIKDKPKGFQLKGYKVLFDFLKFIPLGTNMSAVVYNFNFRRKGHSKMTLGVAWLFFASLFK